MGSDHFYVRAPSMMSGSSVASSAHYDRSYIRPPPVFPMPNRQTIPDAPDTRQTQTQTSKSTYTPTVRHIRHVPELASQDAPETQSTQQSELSPGEPVVINLEDDEVPDPDTVRNTSIHSGGTNVQGEKRGIEDEPSQDKVKLH